MAGLEVEDEELDEAEAAAAEAAAALAAMRASKAAARKEAAAAARKSQQHGQQQQQKRKKQKLQFTAGGKQARVVLPPTLPEQPGAQRISSREHHPNPRYMDE